MEGYKIVKIETRDKAYSLNDGIRSIAPLQVDDTVVDRAYVVTKHDRSVIWHVYDVVEVKYEKA